MEREEGIKKLLVSILGAIAKATDIMKIKNTDCGTLLHNMEKFEKTAKELLKILPQVREECIEFLTNKLEENSIKH